MHEMMRFRATLRRGIFFSCVGAMGSVTSSRSGGDDHRPLFGATAAFEGRVATLLPRSDGAGPAPALARRKADAEEVAVRCLLLDLGLEAEVRRNGRFPISIMPPV